MKIPSFTDKEKLEKIIKITGISRSALARRLEIDYKTIWRWLDRDVTPHSRESRDIDELFKEHFDLREILSDLKRKIKNPIKTLKNNPKTWKELILKMTYNSNAIEGSRMTIKETEMAIAGQSVKGKELFEVLEAVNHKNAMEFMLKEITPGFKIDEKYILKLHEIVMYNFNDKLPGEYRTGYVNLTNSEIKLPSAQDVPLKMGQLIKKINSYGNDPLGKISKDHYEFEVIHPFFDGNGRVGRLIMITQFLSQGFAPAIITLEDRYKYYMGLEKSGLNDFNNLTQLTCEGVMMGYRLLLNE